MSAEGADPSQLDSLAAQFRDAAVNLDERRVWLTGWIEADRFWRGARADEFRSEWSSRFSTQLAQASAFLNNQVDALHRQANQQRTASGEATVDYGGGGFLHKLFGVVKDVDQRVEKDLHGAEHLVRVVGHDVGQGIDAIGKDAREVIGSKEFAEALGVIQVVGTVAAFLPFIPGASEVALAAGAIVMVGHLAQMANAGRFDAGELAEDAVGLVGVGGATKALGLLSDAKGLAGVADAATNVNILRNVADAGAQAKLLTYAAGGAKTAVLVSVEGARVGEAVYNGAQTSIDVGRDIAQGDYSKAANDSLGYGVAVGNLAGKHFGSVTALTTLDQDAGKLGESGSVSSTLVDIGEDK
jgi:hypothetical protein